jgi:hypothetical protein
MRRGQELGTTIIPPFSFSPSYSMFICRRCSAVGLFVRTTWLASLKDLRDLHLGLAEDDARLLLARRLRLADMASCSAAGITTSRISTECTVTPHGFERWSISACSSLDPLAPRSSSVSEVRPMMSRSAVCAAQLTACA